MNEKKVNYHSPLYLQLREVIRSKIESGEYPPGTPIPSENALAETYGIHRLSVRSAISALIYEGLLKSVQGKGVYVTSRKDERDLETIGGFKQTMEQLGHKSSAKILIKATREAGPYYASLLKIDPHDSVYYIKRVLCSDGEPYSLEELYIPTTVLENLPQVDLNVFSMYQIYEFYGIRISRVWERLELEELDPMEARLLDIDSSFAVMKFQGLSYDQHGRIVEYARTYTRGDKCNFSVHYQREGFEARPQDHNAARRASARRAAFYIIVVIFCTNLTIRVRPGFSKANALPRASQTKCSERAKICHILLLHRPCNCRACIPPKWYKVIDKLYVRCYSQFSVRNR